MTRKQANIIAVAVVAVLAAAYYVTQQQKTAGEIHQPVAAAQAVAVNQPAAEKIAGPQGADIVSNSLALVNSAPQENGAVADELDPPEGMEWFYKRFGYSTWFEESKFNVKSFTKPEYESLITAAKGGNESATLALKLSLLRHFQNNPEDTEYNSFKERLLSKEFLISLPLFAYLADALPDELMDDKAFATEILQKSPYNLKFFSERLRSDKELVSAAMTRGSYYVFEFVSESLKNDEEFVAETLNKYPHAMAHISEDLKNNKGLLVPVLKLHPEIFHYASKEVQNDPEVVAAVRAQILNGPQRYFQTLPEKIRGDREVIMKAVQFNCSLLELAPMELRDDEEIVKKATENNSYCLQYASNRLREEMKR